MGNLNCYIIIFIHNFSHSYKEDKDFCIVCLYIILYAFSLKIIYS